MGFIRKALDSLKDAFKEVHHPLNPSAEVADKLKEKGYKFEFNTIACYRAAYRMLTVITPDGTKLNGHNSKDHPAAAAQYKADYEQAVQETAPAPAPQA